MVFGGSQGQPVCTCGMRVSPSDLLQQLITQRVYSDIIYHSRQPPALWNPRGIPVESPWNPRGMISGQPAVTSSKSNGFLFVFV